ncbi:hypothetical protein, partial [Teichococcus deserti]|uniref:hypothetical protein n=1 Tax=Teichococcus deserti TaxID=1817963 RepID=UPI0013F61C26
VDLSGRLMLSGGGAGEAVRVTNLSENGALVTGATQAAAGMQGRLQVEGLDIPASCVGMRGQALVLRLMPGERQLQQLNELLGRLKAA